MIKGHVEFKWAGEAMVAELTEDGWRVPGFPEMARTLALSADPAAFGPADGDPGARALEAAAELLGGTARYAPPKDHPGRIY